MREVIKGVFHETKEHKPISDTVSGAWPAEIVGPPGARARGDAVPQGALHRIGMIARELGHA
jgi:hypothetical protein